MLGSVTREGFNNTVVTLYWNLKPKDAVARHQILEEVGLDVGVGGRSVDVHLDLLEEPGLFICVSMVELLLDLMISWPELGWLSDVDSLSLYRLLTELCHPIRLVGGVVSREPPQGSMAQDLSSRSEQSHLGERLPGQEGEESVGYHL